MMTPIPRSRRAVATLAWLTALLLATPGQARVAAAVVQASAPAAQEAAQEVAPVVRDSAPAADDDAGRPSAPLREVAERAGLLVGTAMSPATLRRDEPWAQLLRREFSSLTPANAMKWEIVHPQAGSWDFRQSDAVVVTAEQYGMAIKGHALVMRRSPAWVERLAGPALRAALEDHVKTLVGRYAGRIRSWDVINEVFEDDGRLRDSVFLRELGPHWVDQVFRWAHAADPAALLLYNDYGIEQPGPKTDAVHELLQRMLDAGVPVHGVGLQSHLSSLEPPDMTAMAATMRRFANLGLSINISELDVRVARYDAPLEERYERQATVFRDVVALCGPGSGVDSVTFWGFSDAHSWIGDRDGKDAPHLFDEDNQPKPAWFAVRAAFAELAEQVRRAGPRVRQAESRPVDRARGRLDAEPSGSRAGTPRVDGQRSPATRSSPRQTGRGSRRSRGSR